MDCFLGDSADYTTTIILPEKQCQTVFGADGLIVLTVENHHTPLIFEECH